MTVLRVLQWFTDDAARMVETVAHRLDSFGLPGGSRWPIDGVSGEGTEMSDSSALGGSAPAVAPKARGAALREWRAGWPVVLAGFFGFVLLSLGNMSMGAFMTPVTTELHWSRSQFSSGLSAYALVGVVMGPLVGALVDKLGVRLVAVIGSLLVGVTFAAFGTATGAILPWLILWLLYAGANQLIMTTVWTAAIARAFNASRGLAMSVIMIGSALAVAVAPFVADRLIQTEGWRTAFFVMGLGTGTAVAVICWFALDGGKPAPGGLAHGAPDNGAADAGPAAMTTGQALRSVAFIKLCIAMFIANFVPLALTIHFIPLLSAGGLSRESAVLVGGSYGVPMFIGQIIGGVAIDRFSGRLVAAIGFVIMAASLALLMLPTDPIAVPIVAVVLFGLAIGGLSPLFPYLTSRYFGLQSFGRLFGVLASLSALAYATGPLAAGYVFDVTRSYFWFLAGSIPALALTILLIVSLGRYPDSAGAKAP
jgi:MFS family permease